MKKVFLLSITIILFNTYLIADDWSAPLDFPSKYHAFQIVKNDTILGVYLKDSKQSRSDLNNLGVQVNTEINGLMTGTVSISDYRLIMRKSLIEWICISGVVYESLDASSTASAASVGRQAANITGSGVVLGIYDTGIDLYSDDFKNSDGTTRIKRIWDQSEEGNPPDPTLFNYGYEWTSSDIDAGNSTEIDLNGHGTHVAGIAGGNGRATGNSQPAGVYVGMAPEADLIVVKPRVNSMYGAWEVDAIDGFNYIIQKAVNDFSSPWAINFSMGTLRGPKNGTSNFESMVDGLIESNFGYGQTIVVAAGNEGDMQLHSENSGNGSIVFRTYDLTATPDWFKIEIFYPDDQYYSFNLEPPNSSARIWNFTTSEWTTYTLANQTINSGSGTGGYDAEGNSSGWLTEDGFVAIHNDDVPVSFDPYLSSNLKCITIDIASWPDLGVDVPNGNWTITMGNGSGRWDAYLVALSNIEFNSGYYTTTGLIREPGNANHVITVGSMNTKNSWQSLAGSIPPVPGFTLNDISNFSSEGPTRDGRTKPEIYAPGAWIASTLSAYSVNYYRPEQTTLDGEHYLIVGTSMAAPHIAGAAALLLEQNPTWTNAQVKNRLINTADETNGYKMLDIHTALCEDREDCSFYPAGFVIEERNSAAQDNSRSPVLISSLVLLSFFTIFQVRKIRKGGKHVA